MAEWFGDELSEFFGDMGTLFFAGFTAFVLQFVVRLPFQMASGSGGWSAVMAFIAEWAIMTALSQAMLLHIAKARLHNREPKFHDLMISPMVLVNLLLVSILTTIIQLAGFFVIGIAFATMIETAMDDAMFLGTTDSVKHVFLSLMHVIIIGGLWAVLSGTLLFFAPNLVVDRRVDFLRALQLSFDCTRRDFLGLLVFVFLWTMLFNLAFAVSSLCCGYIPFLWFLFGPVLYGVSMRAYKDYFGLAPDFVHEEILRAEGFDEFVSQIEEERKSAEQRWGRHGHLSPSATTIPLRPESHGKGEPPPPPPPPPIRKSAFGALPAIPGSSTSMMPPKSPAPPPRPVSLTSLSKTAIPLPETMQPSSPSMPLPPSEPPPPPPPSGVVPLPPSSPPPRTPAPEPADYEEQPTRFEIPRPPIDQPLPPPPPRTKGSEP